ncbi:MAG: peroxide stress protein YaaA [Bacteroidales bacterium]|nr:peroxide stress protein YaaA [Bacteroidales bacterium]
MKIIISPAKSLDFKKPTIDIPSQQPRFQDESQVLVNALKKKSKATLKSLMSISDKLADLNYHRYKEWEKEFNTDVAKQAILTFNGEVYNGLRANDLTQEDLQFANEHLRMLSGLHGILRPFDLIRPYRLEMGIKLKVKRKLDLYGFWGDKIHNCLKEDLGIDNEPVLVNLASAEYFKAALLDKMPYRVVTPVFLEYRDDEYKPITIYFKKARGLMVRFIITNRLQHVEELKLFDYEGYAFHQELSDENKWVFTR